MAATVQLANFIISAADKAMITAYLANVRHRYASAMILYARCTSRYILPQTSSSQCRSSVVGCPAALASSTA
ncbi:hypothetical protein BAUCODRAFT_35381 [Baudoinia panamericana UAMH 10762]|uniref:Uncharacterized protein n=1 Tax=Baudoinia panamericana (strain UAMH 10762) TaxID=717646 RepID=M2N9A0_BAUPA|nr:uncharacterized protein BAUCODRAFT_35381 [Baudoinia panamericana UAMH 10762]EMC95395.1 hypothetical protein BAUCODRAFT_35381 [Baudoinia panamericana UAMH 10762]